MTDCMPPSSGKNLTVHLGVLYSQSKKQADCNIAPSHIGHAFMYMHTCIHRHADLQIKHFKILKYSFTHSSAIHEELNTNSSVRVKKGVQQLQGVSTEH